MQVFKAYFKVIRKNMLSMAIYFVIFLSLVLIMTLFMSAGPAGDFTASRTRMAIIQEDGENVLSKGLAEFLSGKALIIPLATDPDSLQDALFFRQVEYILRIPAGFGQSILEGRYDVELVKISLPDSYGAVQTDLLISRYVNTAALYVDSVPGLAARDLVRHVHADIARQADVILRTAAVTNGYNHTRLYFSYLAYSLMAIMILGITSILLVFNKKDLIRRNNSSPIKLVSLNLQLVLGNLVFALVVWAIFTAISLLISDKSYGVIALALFSFNALAFTLASLGISFLIGNLIKSRNSQQAIANVLALGTCFISGVFVPQELLGPTVKTIASFTPTYWYIANVMDLSSQVITFNFTINVAIQLGFAAAAVIVALVVARQKASV